MVPENVHKGSLQEACAQLKLFVFTCAVQGFLMYFFAFSSCRWKQASGCTTLWLQMLRLHRSGSRRFSLACSEEWIGHVTTTSIPTGLHHRLSRDLFMRLFPKALALHRTLGAKHCDQVLHCVFATAHFSAQGSRPAWRECQRPEKWRSGGRSATVWQCLH